MIGSVTRTALSITNIGRSLTNSPLQVGPVEEDTGVNTSFVEKSTILAFTNRSSNSNGWDFLRPSIVSAPWTSMVLENLATKYVVAIQVLKVSAESFELAAKFQRWRCLNAISEQGEWPSFHTELSNKESQRLE